ncbi:hypothetical protein Acy02nite_68620 [Actinoplanes cyaneus]|uniref:Uncharacterized protein n=1 Tax=Actinoplanes cyaneus TaxID=52696 RepID=A0A919IQ92_9ACTN|nr:hypothetical protein [Actinoplanes cyaneus]MCW2139089.1 hypothetical protein [Actinoplanes cyaneus]GID68981.1 hypothetical protein Acy02nite_68620 [Actinoplanes cyaneus]
MSYRTRSYVPPNVPMYRAAAYQGDRLVDTTGPYATRGAASRSRSRITRCGVVVRVEECFPIWVAVPGTEIAE